MECQTPLGGATGKSAYKHLLLCLHVAPQPFVRIREEAEMLRSERGRRIIHILDAIDPRED
jgi:hypothetical protein